MRGHNYVEQTKMNRYLERVAKENNELFDGGVPDCCKLNQKQNLKKK